MLKVKTDKVLDCFWQKCCVVVVCMMAKEENRHFTLRMAVSKG